jgi:hypothetical protein
MAREACTSVAESNNANCICIYTCDIIHIYIFMVFYSIYMIMADADHRDTSPATFFEAGT